MSELSQVFPEHQFEHGGKVFRLTPPNFKTEKMYSQWLEKRAIEGVLRHKETYGDSFTVALSQVTRDIGANVYGWGSQAMIGSLQSDEAWQELTFYTLRQHHPELIRADMEAMFKAKGQEIVAEIFKMVSRPNCQPPAQDLGQVA